MELKIALAEHWQKKKTRSCSKPKPDLFLLCFSVCSLPFVAANEPCYASNRSLLSSLGSGSSDRVFWKKTLHCKTDLLVSIISICIGHTPPCVALSRLKTWYRNSLCLVSLRGAAQCSSLSAPAPQTECSAQKLLPLYLRHGKELMGLKVCSVSMLISVVLNKKPTEMKRGFLKCAQ